MVAFLGFAIRDDFLALTFPSWPFLINCAENCGYKMVIALFANGILVGTLAFVVMSIVLFSHMFIRKLRRSFVERKATRKT
jgi:Zn-dependent membrane protease YugP